MLERLPLQTGNLNSNDRFFQPRKLLSGFDFLDLKILVCNS